MILGTGVDIVEVSRIKRAVKAWKSKFLKRIFTKNEIDYSKERSASFQHLAGRFAAKEAVLKAFGDSTIHRIEWTNVEILNDEFGKPLIRLSGGAKRAKEKKGVKDIIISVSHTRTYAVATAILTNENGAVKKKA